jgi:hypothetical protein
MPNLVNPYRFGAGAPWTPANLSGVAAWLRADDLDAQADASAVSAWVDRIGSFSFDQATGSKQPTFYKSTSARLINGKQTVGFDGTADLLRYAGTLGTPQSGHIFIVCQLNTLPAAAGTAVILSSSDEASTTRLFEVDLSRPGADTLIMSLQRDNEASGDLLRGNTVLATGTDYVFEVSSTGATTSARVNGTAQTLSVVSGANTGDWSGDTSARDSVVIGCRKTTSEVAFTAMDVAEIVWVNDSNLSAGERTSLNAYILDRYAITL